jgi:hypothetical protein
MIAGRGEVSVAGLCGSAASFFQREDCIFVTPRSESFGVAALRAPDRKARGAARMKKSREPWAAKSLAFMRDPKPHVLTSPGPMRRVRLRPSAPG